MSEVSNIEFIRGLGQKPQFEFMMATIDQIGAITADHRDHLASIEAGKAGDLRVHQINMNNRVAAVNHGLILLGGLSHYFFVGEEPHAAIFMRWDGPGSSSQPDRQSWIVRPAGGGKLSVEVENSVIDEMRATALPAMPPVPTAFTFGIDQIFGNSAIRAKRPRQNAQTIIDKIIAEQQPFSPKSDS